MLSCVCVSVFLEMTQLKACKWYFFQNLLKDLFLFPCLSSSSYLCLLPSPSVEGLSGFQLFTSLVVDCSLNLKDANTVDSLIINALCWMAYMFSCVLLYREFLNLFRCLAHNRGCLVPCWIEVSPISNHKCQSRLIFTDRNSVVWKEQ